MSAITGIEIGGNQYWGEKVAITDARFHRRFSIIVLGLPQSLRLREQHIF